MNGQTYMMKLILAVCNSMNVPKKLSNVEKIVTPSRDL
jgi:hypothetical protein